MTDQQPTLFDDEHEAYDRKYPQVWAEFEKRTLRLIFVGIKHSGARMIMESMRFDGSIDTGETPNINNNHIPYYSEKFMRTHPEHAGFFETRRARIDAA